MLPWFPHLRIPEVVSGTVPFLNKSWDNTYSPIMLGSSMVCERKHKRKITQELHRATTEGQKVDIDLLKNLVIGNIIANNGNI